LDHFAWIGCTFTGLAFEDSETSRPELVAGFRIECSGFGFEHLMELGSGTCLG